MATMAGADADALDRAAHELHRAAERLRSGRSRVERPLHSAPWHGRGADAFRQEWGTTRAAEIVSAANFLDGAVETLRRNADEQRRASAGAERSGVGSRPAAPASDAALSPELERVRLQLELLGLSVDQIKNALELMLALAATPGFDIGPILSTLENLGRIADLSDVVGKVSTGLDVAGYVIDFLDGAAAHSHLPFDEMMVAATVTVGVSVAMGVGTDFAGQLVGKGVAAALLATGVGAPAAPLADFVASRVASFVIGEAVEFADERFDITGNSVEAALDTYRYAKTHDLGDMAYDAVRNTGEAFIDGAAEVGDKLTFWN